MHIYIYVMRYGLAQAAFEHHALQPYYFLDLRKVEDVTSEAGLQHLMATYITPGVALSWRW